MNTVCALLAAFALAIPASAFGLSASFPSPQLGFPEGTPQKAVEQVLQYLTKEVTFVDGSFLNEYTTQRFSGPMSKLSGLLELLRTQGRLDVQIRFADLKDERVDFAIFQNSHSHGEVILTVNVAKKLDWSKLRIQIPSAKKSVE